MLLNKKKIRVGRLRPHQVTARGLRPPSPPLLHHCLPVTFAPLRNNIFHIAENFFFIAQSYYNLGGMPNLMLLCEKSFQANAI